MRNLWDCRSQCSMLCWYAGSIWAAICVGAGFTVRVWASTSGRRDIYPSTYALNASARATRTTCTVCAVPPTMISSSTSAVTHAAAGSTPAALALLIRKSSSSYSMISSIHCEFLQRGASARFVCVPALRALGCHGGACDCRWRLCTASIVSRTPAHASQRVAISASCQRGGSARLLCHYQASHWSVVPLTPLMKS